MIKAILKVRQKILPREFPWGFVEVDPQVVVDD